jgi:nucleotide-binding universal stress UspA family protein
LPPRAPDVGAGSPIQFRRILCAVDSSESSLDALAYAINMAEEADAQLTLLHVVEFLPPLVTEPGGPCQTSRAFAKRRWPTPGKDSKR